jgi:hypothetical protein
MTNSIDAALAELAALAAAAEEATLEPPESSTALVPTGGTLPATQVKKQMAVKRAEIVKMRAEVERRVAEVERLLKDKVYEIERVIGPMREMVARLEEGIWTVNLYLGRDEEILTLAEGEPAPGGTPITVRQMVLSMDQESMIAAEQGGIDARSIEAFDQWLEDPAHLEQVLPEPKGVVVLVPRRTGADYGDPWLQKRMDEENHQSYWLIRNGDRLYRMATNFSVGKNLVPLQDEFTSFFTERRWNSHTHDYDTVRLAPGTDAWLKAEKAAGDRQRHFMRAALILQGLIDRTTVFHPLSGLVSFLNPESYDEGQVKIITDAELALTTGRESFRDYQRRLNAQLRPGMRIVGAFNSEDWRDANSFYAREQGEHTRISPPRASTPPSGELLTITGRVPHSDQLTVQYKRTDKKWVRTWIENPNRPGWGYYGHEEQEYKQRATLTIDPADRFFLPFDLVTVAELETYLHARLEREDYIVMVPTIKVVIAAKRAEQAEEEPFRRMLQGVLATDGIPANDDEVAALVDWWKLGNRWHRPLVDPDEATQAKAIRAITAEHRRRQSDTDVASRQGRIEADMVAKILPVHPRVMLIARRRDGKFVALEPTNDENVFVTRRTFGLRSDPVSEEWVLPGRGRAWRVLFSTDRWAQWNHEVTPATVLTEPEIRVAVEELREMHHDGEHGVPLAINYDPDARRFYVFTDEGISIDVDAEHLLTNPPRDHSYPGREYWWKRRPDGSVELIYSHKHSYTSRVGRPAWENRSDWERANRPVWTDDVRIAELHKRLATAEVAGRLSGHLRDEADAVHHSIRKAWSDRIEAELYARFLEDYADPDLWEGHRKTLRLPDFPLEHARRFGSSGSLWFRAVDRLIESGMQLDGFTVRQVLELYESLGPDPIPIDPFNEKRPYDPVPEDFMDFVVSARPEPFEPEILEENE